MTWPHSLGGVGTSERVFVDEAVIADTVNGRSYWSQWRELMRIAITYGIMLLYAAVEFLQSNSGSR